MLNPVNLPVNTVNMTLINSCISRIEAWMEILKSIVQTNEDRQIRTENYTHRNAIRDNNSSDTRWEHNAVSINDCRTEAVGMNNVVAITTIQQMANENNHFNQIDAQTDTVERENTINDGESNQIAENVCTASLELNAYQISNNENDPASDRRIL